MVCTFSRLAADQSPVSCIDFASFDQYLNTAQASMPAQNFTPAPVFNPVQNLTAGAFKPVPIPEAHLKMEKQRQNTASRGASISQAICCALRPLMDNIISLGEGGSALNAQQAHSNVPQTETQIIGAGVIGGVAGFGGWSALKTALGYREKQKLTKATLFYSQAYEKAAQTPEEQSRVEAPIFAHDRMHRKVRREKWFSGFLPMGSMGFMGGAQGNLDILPGSLGASAALDVAQVGKIMKEVHDDRPVLERAALDAKYTQKKIDVLEEALTNPLLHKVKNIADNDVIAANHKKIRHLHQRLEEEKLHLEALFVQMDSYLAPKQREQKISGTLWGVQAAGAAMAAVGTGIINPIVAGIGIGLSGIATLFNLRFNTRVNDSERFAPEPKTADYLRTKEGLTIRDGQVVGADPQKLYSRYDIDKRLVGEAEKRKVVKAFDGYFWSQQKTRHKVVYHVWRNFNRVLGFVTLGLMPDTYGQSKLAAKTYISNRFVRQMLDKPDVFSHVLDVLQQLPGKDGTLPSTINDMQTAPNNASERLGQFYDVLKNSERTVGDVGKLEAKKVLKSASSWSWKPKVARNWRNGGEQRAALKSLLPVHQHELIARKPYQGVFDIDTTQHAIKMYLENLLEYGPCCDTDVDGAALIDDKKGYFLSSSSLASDAQRAVLEKADYETTVRYIWKVARKDARRDIGYYSEYLAGFQKNIQ